MCFNFYRILMLFFQREGAQWACCNKLMYKHVLITTPTAIHCVGWLPFSFSLLSVHFPPLALSTSLAIYQVNSRLKRVWRPGIPKGVMPPQLQPQPPTSFCNHSTRARAALKGIKMNWMKIEIENENEKWKMKTHAKRSENQGSTQKIIHIIRNQKGILYILNALEWVDAGKVPRGALNSRQRLSNTNESTRIRIRIRWVACLFTDVCAQIY